MFKNRLSLWRRSLPVALLLYATLIVAGCEATDMENDRPEDVPTETLWIGGMDGGVYLVIRQSPNAEPHVYEATVYTDVTGAVWYQGRFVMEPASEPEFDYRDSTSYSSWDGDTLHLRDGRTLHAVD